MIIDNRNKKTPTLSIVTVTFNSIEDLKETVSSVLSQTFKNYEFIIIDGNSSDGTLPYLESNKDNFNFILSENDDGIYFAMNKGLRIAAGNWVQFLNAGDVYESNETLEKIFKKEIEPDSIIFGRSYTEYNNRRKIRYKDFNLNENNWFIKKMPNHQAVFIPRKLYRFEEFDINIKITSDTQYLRRIFRMNKNIHFTDDFVSVFQLGGRSNYYGNINTLKIILSDTAYMYKKGLKRWNKQVKHIFKFVIQKLLGKERYLKWYLNQLQE